MTHLRRLFALIMLCAVAFPLARAHAAEPAPPTMLVIDGSGSMWGRFGKDKRPKIDVVRDHVLSRIDAAGDLPIGLASFGHRRKSDCTDIEIISAPVTDHTEEKSAIQSLSPRGKGPLAEALHAAAEALAPAGSDAILNPASMIVINDGLDNCRQDTCTTATDIAKHHPGLAIHIISLGISPEDTPRLSCIAKATGGTYRNVDDDTALATAMDEVTQLALQPPGAKNARGPVAAGGSDKKKPEVAGLQATASLASGGAAINLPVHWRVFKAGGDKVLAEADGPTLKATLDPGTYDVEASFGDLRAKREVSVSAGHSAGIIVPLGAARLTAASKGETSAITSQTVIVTIDPKGVKGQSPVLLRKLGEPQILRPGKYSVTVTDGTVRSSKSVDLSAGDDATLAFTLGAGRIELSAAQGAGGGSLDDVTFSISEDDPDSPDGRREVARSRAPAPAFTVPTGTYYASARAGDGEVHERIAVGAGDVVKRTLILPLVAVKVSSLIGDTPATSKDGISYRITARDDNREVVRSVLPNLSLSLMPGQYQFAAHLDTHHLKAARDVTIEPGKSADVVLKFDAGEVDLKPGADAPAGGDTFWEITDHSGKPIWRSLATEAHAFLAPGRYVVRLDKRDRSGAAAFEIKAGERKLVEVDTN